MISVTCLAKKNVSYSFEKNAMQIFYILYWLKSAKNLSFNMNNSCQILYHPFQNNVLYSFILFIKKGRTRMAFCILASVAPNEASF